MTASEVVLLRQKARIAEGRCAFCGKPREGQHKWTCEACAAKANQRNKEYRAMKKRLGLCSSYGCTSKLPEGSRWKRCETCRRIDRMKANERANREVR